MLPQATTQHGTTARAGAHVAHLFRLLRLDVVLILAMVTLLMGAAESGTESSISLTDVTGLLREFGFPIFVSVWFMWRLERRMDAFTESINKLLTIVTIMSKSVDELSMGRTGTGVGRASGKDVA
jgi:hypothetical protein